MSEDMPGPPEKPDWALTPRERRARVAGGTHGGPRRRFLRWLVLIVVVAAAVVVWMQMRGREAPAVSQADDSGYMQLIPSEIATVAAGELRESVKATGSLSPEREVHVSAEVAGRIDDLLVEAGDSVVQGQLLVRIDRETLENQLEQQRATARATEAQLELSKAQLKRTQSLVDRGVQSASELESGQAEVDQLEANLSALQKQVEAAETSLGHTMITAPFTGMIATRSVDPGAYVTIGTELLSMVDLTRMEFEAAVPVRYAPQLAPGQPVELSVEGMGGRSYQGVVDRINPVATEDTRMLPVYVGLDNPDQVLRGGMFASGSVILRRKENAIGVPADAVMTDQEGTYVLKIVDSALERQGVETGSDWSGGRVTEILSGLVPGDVIIALPMEQLRPGTRVEMLKE